MYDELYSKLRQYFSQDKPLPSSLMYELAEARANALQSLLEARGTALRPKADDVTDLDRKTHMEGWTAEKERDYRFLDSLWEIARTAGTDARDLSH